MDGADLQAPPQNLRIKYYLFETRLPPVWLPWAEKDI